MREERWPSLSPPTCTFKRSKVVLKVLARAIAATGRRTVQEAEKSCSGAVRDGEVIKHKTESWGGRRGGREESHPVTLEAEIRHLIYLLMLSAGACGAVSDSSTL